jgi:3-hydroxyacyl-CoA dehydrogenase
VTTFYIERAAVIGAGTMGSGIAAHLANAGVPVLLLDVPGAPGEPRNAPAERALRRIESASPPPLVHPDRAGLITLGNVEDDLHRLGEADWIAEAVVERLEVKQALYRRIDAVRKRGSLVSSNTSTIPLRLLCEGMPEAFRRDFCITHFFNPVRFMPLLELVCGPDTAPQAREALREFCDRRLGKGVVPCADTPGFLANRVGCFALQVGLVEAEAAGLGVEEADAVMGRPMGIPKTGLFGLYDLIGLDLMLDVASSLTAALPDDDPFVEVASGIPAVHRLVGSGRAGNKSGAGFYRTVTVDGERVREAVDLGSCEYRTATREVPDAVRAAETGGLRALVEHDSRCGRFAARVLARTLGYAAALIPDVGEDLVAIDEAMRLGYNWSRGPFELIDDVGPDWLRARLAEQGRAIPPLLQREPPATMYRVESGRLERACLGGGYRPVRRAPGVRRLADVARVQARLEGNEAASLWDLGDGVACLAFHSKANALSPSSMAGLVAGLRRAQTDFRALVVHGQGAHFSVGFDLGFVLACARDGAFERLDLGLLDFQEACMALRYAGIPVVGAPSGMALGGGFEVLAHCDAVLAHSNTVLGLVEPMVGLVPSGGGCKEMLARWTLGAGDEAARREGALAAFGTIRGAVTASSPRLAEPLRLLRTDDRSTLSRERLLAEAKALALALDDDYVAPHHPLLEAVGSPGRDAMELELARLAEGGLATPHDLTVGRHLARIMSGNRAAGSPLAEDDLHELEREAFLSLAGTAQTIARIEHTLRTGRPLRN